MNLSWDAEQIRLDDEHRFETLNGLWTGKKPPFVIAGVIRNTNFTESGRVDYSDVAWLQVEQKQLAKRQLKPGDIIVERSGGGPKQPVGRVVYFDREDGPFSFSNFTSAIRVRDREAFDSKFVFYGLLELYQSGRTEDIQRRTTGIRNLDFTAYKERAAFPQIPIPEQRKIAGVLGVVQRAIEQQERLLQLTTELKKTLLHQLFTRGLRGEPQKQTEIGPVPKIWGVRAIKSLGTTIQSGQTPLRRNHELYGNDVSWVKTLDLNNGLVSETEERLSYKGFEDLGKKLRPVDTVMVAMYGGAGTIGKCGILAIPATTNQAVCCIEPNDRVFNPRYLLHYMVYFRPRWMTFATGTRKDPNISKAIVENLVIPFPSLSEQQEISRTLDAVAEKEDFHCRKHATLTALLRTLLHQLMTAQIRVHDLELPALD